MPHLSLRFPKQRITVWLGFWTLRVQGTLRVGRGKHKEAIAAHLIKPRQTPEHAGTAG